MDRAADSCHRETAADVQAADGHGRTQKPRESAAEPARGWRDLAEPAAPAGVGAGGPAHGAVRVGRAERTTAGDGLRVQRARATRAKYGWVVLLRLGCGRVPPGKVRDFEGVSNVSARSRACIV